MQAIARAGALATIAACAAALGACGSAEGFVAPAAATAPIPRSELGLHPGESMSFEVKLGGLPVGEAALAVGELGELDGRPAITVGSKISTTGAARLIRPVDDESTTVIDAETGTPLKLSSHVLMGGRETFTDAVFTKGAARVEVRRAKDRPGRAFTFTFGELSAHDAHSAMADVRGWRPAAKAQRTVWLIGGRRMWRVDLIFAGEDSVGTAAGNRDALRLDGVAYRINPNRTLDETRPPRRFSVWLSSDADRVPLKVTATTELGDIEITLSEYQRP